MLPRIARSPSRDPDDSDALDALLGELDMERSLRAELRRQLDAAHTLIDRLREAKGISDARVRELEAERNSGRLGAMSFLPLYPFFYILLCYHLANIKS
jgi:ribosome assembly protein YihI (activator of Der GTPase)